MRYIKEFKDFMLSIGYKESVAYLYTLHNKKNEEYLCYSEMPCGRSIDDIISDDGKMGSAISALEDIGRSDFGEYQSALRLYYYFVNKRWYDSWISPKINPKGRMTPEKKYGRKFPIDVPDTIPRWGDDGHGMISYAPNVTENEKIEGLPGFLLGEYDHIVSSRGRFILDEGIRIFGEENNSFQFVPIVLSNDLPYREYHESDEYIAKKIANSNKTYEDILRILKTKNWTSRISGMYHHSGCPENLGFNLKEAYRFEDGSIPYITIYYRNTECPDVEEYMTSLGNLFAHEYFHFMHDVFAQEEFNRHSGRRIKEREAVVEALADFFSVAYTFHWYDCCLNHPYVYEKIAEKKYAAWVKRFGSSWPYAHAYWFYQVNGRTCEFTPFLSEYRAFGSIDKFNDVLRKSRYSMGEAYSKLTLW